MKQHEVVIRALSKLGGYATLADLYKEVLADADFEHNTKTPRETIRRIVQTRDEIFPFASGFVGIDCGAQEHSARTYGYGAECGETAEVRPFAL